MTLIRRRLGSVGMLAGIAMALNVIAGNLKSSDRSISFNRDIRPILANNCYSCHGPDVSTRKADLRLDNQESAHAEVIVPGQPDESELYYRIITDDEDDLMPTLESTKSLSEEEKDLVRRWILAGAEYEPHWAYVSPKRVALPEVKTSSWGRNPIDAFVLQRLEASGLSPAPEANRRALVRRVALDLTGLPPESGMVEAFLADASSDAYERLVDRLLESDAYGEHMARYWLDAARYGDTHGLHLDNYREIWPYRDWVINAFNENQSFEAFVLEQVAGDLLPKPTRKQQIATGFNRAHVTTNEGGSIEEEVYVRNVLDRVTTFGTVFMGMTTGCAVCHDHKFDPLKQKEFYQLFAFFNSLDGKAMDGNRKDPAPIVAIPSEAQEEEVADCERRLATIESTLREQVAAYSYQEPAKPRPLPSLEPSDVVWLDDSLPKGAKPSVDWNSVEKGKFPVLSGERAFSQSAVGTARSAFVGAKDELEVDSDGKLFVSVYLDPLHPPRELMVEWYDGDWEHQAYWGEDLLEVGKQDSSGRVRVGELPETGKWVRLEVAASRVGLAAGTKVSGLAVSQFDGTVFWDRAGAVVMVQPEAEYDSFVLWLEAQRRRVDGGVPKDLIGLLEKERSSLSEPERQRLLRYFVEYVLVDSRELFAPAHQWVGALKKQIAALKRQYPTSLVWKEAHEPRPAYVLDRGLYNMKKAEVTRGTPEFLPPLAEGASRDRLGLARWLLTEEHPLTARVAVNRFWQQVFGVGIVKTAEDFGLQGEWPSHPELLDWLAVEFRESGWDVKALIRLMVTSATYRQSSSASPELYRRDPENRLLGRGPRFRLDAEVLRDQALSVSGLLVRQLGGPPVKPPQPDGLWFAVGYTGSNTVRFEADHGADKVHRRSLYTFWKRTAPPPQMSAFDAPSREACSVRRERTNTPLQALLLMNDPQYVEAARTLAERMFREGGETIESQLRYGFELATLRLPKPEELSELMAAYEDYLAIYREDPESARQALAVGEFPWDPQFDPVALAAGTMVANVILNLDEVVNKG